jgi:hypothetical protein
MQNPRPTVIGRRGFRMFRVQCLLAAVALKKIHRVNGYCVAAYRFAVVFHEYPLSYKNLNGIAL